MSEYVVRELRKEDCPRLLELLKEHSVFHGFPVTNTLQALERDGFEEKCYDCFVAEINMGDKGKTVVGHCIFCTTYAAIDGKSLFIEDFFVDEKFRRKGIATALWNKVCQVAVQRRAVGLYFNVLKRNENAIKFYKAKGCCDLTEKEGFLTFTLDRPGIEACVERK